MMMDLAEKHSIAPRQNLSLDIQLLTLTPSNSLLSPPEKGTKLYWMHTEYLSSEPVCVTCIRLLDLILCGKNVTCMRFDGIGKLLAIINQVLYWQTTCHHKPLRKLVNVVSIRVSLASVPGSGLWHLVHRWYSSTRVQYLKPHATDIFPCYIYVVCDCVSFSYVCIDER